jgi:hypothetical protein
MLAISFTFLLSRHFSFPRLLAYIDTLYLSTPVLQSWNQPDFQFPQELTLGLVRPDVLGKKFLLSLLAKRVRENSTKTRAKGNGVASLTGSGPAWVVGLCPNIKVLGFKYRRWFREHESDEITPMLREIVDTRARSSVPLQSCKLWPTKYTTDAEVKELVHKFEISDRDLTFHFVSR